MIGEKSLVSRPKDTAQNSCRLIAFYLPQFHPIPENDIWWGKGFTEWINVARARPLFRGHYQPRLPADLGFYDLRVPETRIAQAEMAQQYSLEGFCYWHYWFAGKRLLERPFNVVLKSGQPDFPFCLAWANSSWTGIWQNAPDRMLIEQTYPGIKDYEAHFFAILDAFFDERYMTVEGKPIFVVYNPVEMPAPGRFIACWQELAVKVGLPGLYFIGIAMPDWDPRRYGFDATVLSNPAVIFSGLYHQAPGDSALDRACKKITGKTTRQIKNALNRRLDKPIIHLYKHTVPHAVPTLALDFRQYPCVIPNWDNTPRCGSRGIVFHQSTPELFGTQLHQAIEQVLDREPDQRLIFIKSWNEWAEGNYLEPDQRFGKTYLEIIKKELELVQV